uniref:Uncharacterized protein n=1 Tax=Meloidogyne incognita TaxID=6306 RepID=A0A914MMI1_MELIC
MPRSLEGVPYVKYILLLRAVERKAKGHVNVADAEANEQRDYLVQFACIFVLCSCIQWALANCICAKYT